MICLEEHEIMTKFPQCTHYACIGCYKRIYFGSELESDHEEVEEPSVTSCPMCRGNIEHNKWWGKKKST